MLRTIPEFGRRMTGVLPALGIVSLVAVATGCGGGDDVTGGDRPVIAVTSSVLGDLVERLAGDWPRIEVVIPDGVDPHEFAPSARDLGTVDDAVIVVANGLGLEEQLEDVLARREERGAPVFRFTDHVPLRGVDGPEPGADGVADPHVWLDPVTMAAAVGPLADLIGTVLGIDLSDAEARLVEELGTLDDRVAEVMSGVEPCRLVTGHDSLGYFAARYGCEVIGAVIPGLSSTGEPSAGEIADLAALARSAGVRAVFTEVGTPPDVAAQVAAEVGVPLVELSTHSLPEGGGYDELLVGIATTIADASA